MISNLSMPQIHELLDLIPSPCVVFDLARRRGIFVVGDTPSSPGIRLRRIALATLFWLSPIRHPRLW